MKNLNLKRKYFKDGNPEYFTFFTDKQWKNMTAAERKWWTPASDIEKAIPDEVREFLSKSPAVIAPPEKPAPVTQQPKVEEFKPEKQPDRQFYKEALKEMSVKFNPNLGIEKLKALYAEATKDKK